MNIKLYSNYYQATIKKSEIWFVTGCLRAEDGWVFDRALDHKQCLIEFFVAPDFTEQFLFLMSTFINEGYVFDFKSLPNRLETNPDAAV